jgi:hypothetical protein
MNTHYVKFTGSRFELSTPLDGKAHHVFQGSGEVIRKTEIDNKDGTFEYIYTFSPKFLDLREAKNEIELPESVIKRNVSSSMTLSQEMRFFVEKLYEAKGNPGDKEEFYRNYMRKHITKLQAEIEIERGV